LKDDDVIERDDDLIAKKRRVMTLLGSCFKNVVLG
jgi:hypothetical protein